MNDFERSARPTTKSEAVRLIDETYRYNEWNEAERSAHQRQLGLEPKPLHLMTVDELRVIIDRMESSRMAIFK